MWKKLHGGSETAAVVMIRSYRPLWLQVQTPQRAGSVPEGAAAARSTDEIFQQVAIDLPESGRLSHLGQVIHAKLEAELLQVLGGTRGAGLEPAQEPGRSRICPRTDLCVVANGSRQQGEGVVDGDASLYDVLAEPLQPVLTVRRGQIQQPWRGRDSRGVSGSRV